MPPYFTAGRLRLHVGVPEALAANLISPGRGLLVFSPVVVVLAVAGGVLLRGGPGSRGWLAGALALACVGHWLVVSSFPHWWGGYSYGPRFLNETAVPLVLLAAPALERLRAGSGRGWHPRIPVVAVGVLGLWSAGVHAQPAFLLRPMCWNAVPHVDEHPWRVWDWSDPQPLAGARSLLWPPPHERVVASYRGTSSCY
jgi:hypothetical protein